MKLGRNPNHPGPTEDIDPETLCRSPQRMPPDLDSGAIIGFAVFWANLGGHVFHMFVDCLAAPHPPGLVGTDRARIICYFATGDDSKAKFSLARFQKMDHGLVGDG